MTDRTASPPDNASKKPSGIFGVVYLLLAGIAMTAWIVFLVWIAHFVFAGL